MASSTSPWGPPPRPLFARAAPEPRPSCASHIPTKPKSGKLDVARYLDQAQKPEWTYKARAVRDNLAFSKAKFPKHVFAFWPTPGVPPAPIQTYGIPDQVGQHVYQWDPATTMAAHFRPDRHTMMINGRPMQATSLLQLDLLASRGVSQAEPLAACKASSRMR